MMLSLQNNEKVVLVVARKKISAQSTIIRGRDESDGVTAGPETPNGVKVSSLTLDYLQLTVILKVSHTRSKSAPSSRPRDSDSDTLSEVNGVNGNDHAEEVEERTGGSQETIRNGNNNLHHGSSDSVVNEPFYDLPEGEDYMAIYETIDRKRQEAKEMKIRSASMEELETPNASLKSFNINSDSVTTNCKAEPQIPRDKRRTRSKSGSKAEHRKSIPEALPQSYDTNSEMAQFLKKALRIEGPQLSQKIVSIRKNARESLGMRIGGGIGSNEGDTPIYIANIHPHGCIGKSKQMKVRDSSVLITITNKGGGHVN